jgi:EpsI family protein
MSSPSLSSASSPTPLAGQNPPDRGAAVPPNDTAQVPLWRSAAILALGVLAGLAYLLNPPLIVQPQSGVVMDLPVLLGDYLGKKGEITQVEHDLLPKDTEFARRFYVDSQGHEINCSIVLSGAEQRSIHRPEGCLTGQGWTIIGQDTIPISLLSGRTLKARKLTLERTVIAQTGEHIELRAFYIYWFVGQGVTTPFEIQRVLLSNWDRVMHNQAQRWAYVSVFSLITEGIRPDGLNAEQTEKVMTDFARQIVPTFQISEMPAQAKD